METPCRAMEIGQRQLEGSLEPMDIGVQPRENGQGPSRSASRPSQVGEEAPEIYRGLPLSAITAVVVTSCPV